MLTLFYYHYGPVIIFSLHRVVDNKELLGGRRKGGSEELTGCGWYKVTRLDWNLFTQIDESVSPVRMRSSSLSVRENNLSWKTLHLDVVHYDEKVELGKVCKTDRGLDRVFVLEAFPEWRLMIVTPRSPCIVDQSECSISAHCLFTSTTYAVLHPLLCMIVISNWLDSIQPILVGDQQSFILFVGNYIFF